MLRALLRLRSPGGRGARLSILIFHRVLPAPDPIFPGEAHAASFDAVCGWLAHWFAVLPLDEAVRRLRAGTLPAAAACITFDDGYADNHDVALPILRRHGLSATFFVATSFLGGGRMFNDSVIEAVRRAAGPTLDLSGLGLAEPGVADIGSDERRRGAIESILGAVKYLPPAQRVEVVAEVVRRCGSPALPDGLMMTARQVRALREAGMGIGAHTATHPILARLDEASARDEIERGRRDLEAIIGERVALFAYPNGKPGRDYTAAHVALARQAGFEAAVSTAWGAGHASSDPFQLPRFTPWDRTRARFGWRLLSNLSRPCETV